MTEPLTQNIQDYLKAIYGLTSDGGKASTTALAARLGIAAPSVTGMLQKLAALRPPLVVYQKHRGAHLTPEGERAALEVLRHHRLLEAWLVESLGYSWDAVHEEACKLEHVISEEFERRIAAALGHPVRDPHGAPIPSAELVMPPTNDVPLGSLHGGERAVVRRVDCEDAPLLQRLKSLGLAPGAELNVLEVSPFDSGLTVQVTGQKPVVIDPATSSHIFVETVETMEA
ncbi:MAG: DtxR family transcriptional regulator Mn-dependent transcriptional regulator [Anaerolineaceae bacterium]|nr:MAG: DtxR family transcriptional regulator Mn-dependent transcriptional regulator [Anaerolineaceae bacterium]